MNKKILVALACASTLASAETLVLDDFEDENTTAEGIYKTAYWYIYTDKGTVTNAQDKTTESWDIIRTEGDNHYAAMEGIAGIISGSTEYPSVGMGLDVGGQAMIKCSDISYKYKGSGHVFRALIDGVTADKGYEHVSPLQPASNEWKTVTLSASDIEQPSWVSGASAKDVKPFSWEGIKKLSWVVSEKLEQADIGTELLIDDITCTGSGEKPANNDVISKNVAIIDDFEDENTAADSLDKKAYWYLYTVNSGTVTNEKDASDTWDVIRGDATGHYIAMEGISGITPGDTTYPSVGIGLDVPDGALSACTAIQYDYKGSAHKFRASLSTVTADEGYDHVSDDFDAAADWTTVVVSASNLTQPDWVKTKSPKDYQTFNWKTVSKLAWVVDEKLTAIGTDLAIDNVACLGTLTKATKNSIAVSRKVAGLNASINGFNLDVTVAKSSMVKVHVFDMQGQVAKTFSENVAGSRSFDLRGLAKGSYLVRVSSGSMVKTARIAIK